MSVQDKMTQLQAVKADIKQALIDKGVDMTNIPFTGYAEKITEMKGDKIYLYKDGILEPSIPLGSGLSIKNNVIYTNAAGGTNWSISYPIEQNTTLYVKLTCTADAGSPGNEAYLSANFGGKNGVIRFPGDGEVNDHLTLGILAGSAATSFNLYFYTYGSAMGIEEIWIE